MLTWLHLRRIHRVQARVPWCPAKTEIKNGNGTFETDFTAAASAVRGHALIVIIRHH